MDNILPVLPLTSKHSSRASNPRDNLPTSRSNSLQSQSSGPSMSERIDKQTPSRVAFVPGSSELYGAINCKDLKKNIQALPTTSTHGRLKSGPPLLEIRRLNYVFPGKHHMRSYNNLFEHKTVLISRGISGLGANISSTCLSFCPLTEPQKISSSTLTVARCATGLTSGALCIHTITNLHDSIDQADPPSSIVAHYAPRQQRPVTSVTWCSSTSKKSGLVAVGLTGSGTSGNVKTGLSQTSSASRKGPVHVAPPAAMSPVAAGGDRDFGCLIWDIEGQSSSISGGGTVGGIGKGSGASIPIKSKRNLFF